MPSVREKSPARIPTVQEKLARWQKELTKRAAMSAKFKEPVSNRGPNEPIVVTHMSPARSCRHMRFKVGLQLNRAG